MHTCEDMILYCLWKGLVRNCRRIFEVRYTDDGLCCSFNTIPLEDYLYDKLMAFQNIVSINFFFYYSKAHTEFNVGIEKLYDIDPCQAWLDVEMGTFMNPNFPKNYSNNIFCTWIIKAPDNSIVTLKIESFDVSFTFNACLSLDVYKYIFLYK